MTTVDFAQIDKLLENSYPQMERDLIGLLSFPEVLGMLESEGQGYNEVNKAGKLIVDLKVY